MSYSRTVKSEPQFRGQTPKFSEVCTRPGELSDFSLLLPDLVRCHSPRALLVQPSPLSGSGARDRLQQDRSECRLIEVSNGEAGERH